MSYFREVLLGTGEYFTVNKLITICLAIILYEFFVHEKLNAFMKYTLVALLLVLLPVTAVVLLKYQSALYEYGLLWTLVPVTAVVSYAGVRFLWDMLPGMEKTGKGKYVIGTLAVCGIIFLLGNRGIVQRVSLEEAELRRGYEQLAEALPEETMLWGPRDMMQWIRRKNGDVKLAYGLDMWDAKAAAYDGDAYAPELIEAYEWMQAVEGYNVYVENASFIWFEIPEFVIAEAETVFETMENQGVNVIVFTTGAYEQLKGYLPTGYETREVGKYTLLQGKR